MNQQTNGRPSGGAVAIAERPPELNPFTRTASNAAAAAENERAIAETQAAMVIAQRFPRNQVDAMDRILQAFTRPSLAETALYEYARGGQTITGPSIRAAEAIAQNWGNLQYGVRELEQRPGESTVEAFCWDVQTNTRSVKVFQVRHERHTRNDVKRLTDPRDIYELIANQGARRVRACILGIIPGDVVEAAVKQVETTLRTKIEISPELIENLLTKFAKHGVSRRALESWAQRRLDTITPGLVVRLGKIWNSLNDGMSAPADWFKDLDEPTAPGAGGEATKTRTEAVRDKLLGDDQDSVPPAADPEPGLFAEVDFSKMSAAKIADYVESIAAELRVSGSVLNEITQSVVGDGKLDKTNAAKVVQALRDHAEGGQ